MSIAMTIIGIVLTIGISFLFSGMEAGLFGLSRVRIRQLMRTGDRRAVLLHGYLERPEPFLWTILTGNTIANFLLVALLVTTLFDRWPVKTLTFWGTFAVSLFLIYVLLDLLPKMLFRRFPNRLCLSMVRPFRWLAIILVPIVTPLEWLATLLAGGKARASQFFGNREELRALMQGAQNPLTSEERHLVGRVLSLQKLTVQRVAVPWEKVHRITEATPAAGARTLLAGQGHSRMPVMSADEQKVVGVVTIKSLLHRPQIKAGETVRDYMTPALFFSANTRLEEALKQFQLGGHRQAIVIDAASNPVGIVSMTDVLKIMFGEVTL